MLVIGRPLKYDSAACLPTAKPIPVMIPVHMGKKNTVRKSSKPAQIIFFSFEEVEHELTGAASPGADDA